VAGLVSLALAQAALGGAVGDDEGLGSFGELGSGAGQTRLPRGLGSDPLTGNLFIAEEGATSRISEFTPWGGFVKAFGWDVAPGAVNEQQEVRIRAKGGQFKLGFEAQQTTGLSLDASAQEVREALEALAAIPSGGVKVERVAGVLDGKVPVIYVVEFIGGLAGEDIPQLEAIGEGLSGGIPATAIEARTRADGHGATTGLESCTEESSCKAGEEGAGAGQLHEARGVAVDANGNVYVADLGNHRVQKFDSAGRFVLMLGGEVDKTTHANVCTAEDIEASGDECGVGLKGIGNGEFDGKGGMGIALCPTGSSLCPSGALFVADDERVERFTLGGDYQAQFSAGGGRLATLALDPGHAVLYASFETKAGVFPLDPETGSAVGEAREGGSPIATDAAGDLFASLNKEVREYDSEGKPLSPPSCCEVPESFSLRGLATNSAGDLYVGAVRVGVENLIHAYGPGPTSLEAPPHVPPELKAEFAASAWEDGATLRALINPRFWSDTRYLVQYGTGKCSEGGCTEEVPAPPGALLTEKTINKAIKTSGVDLEGLTSGATYHYRFVTESGGGGPTVGEEAIFITPRQLPQGSPCPNQALRIGAATHLPDCRAFEMVSPNEKENGDIEALVNELGFKTGLVQSATDGQSLTYSTFRAFGKPEGAPYASQYLARRGAGGWSNESIDPPIEALGVVTENNLPSSENLFKSFSPDLCESWLVAAAEPALGPGSIAEYPNLYRRDDCGDGSYEALLREGQAQPTGELTREEFLPEMQGTSTDGEEAAFRVKDKLTEEAAGGKTWQAYFASPTALRLLCVLPSGVPGGGNCSVGTGGQISPGRPNQNRLADVTHAVSEDGTHVYWTASGASGSGPGKVYLRLNPSEEQSEVSGGECTEAQKACTVKVSETVTTKASRFLTATPDGAKALFEVTEDTSAGNLYEFDAGSGEATLVAKAAGMVGDEPYAGLLGASTDLSYVYLTSTEASPQAEAEGAVSGRPNLYLAHEGALSFVATLSTLDVANAKTPSDTSPNPVYHAARVSPNGKTLAFLSTESLTGYDNADQESEEADSEVYLYQPGSAGLVCVSCAPSGARPVGRGVSIGESASPLPSAATLPAGQSLLHFPRSLSADGERLFFDSFDSLLPRDTNGIEDVYEWEAAGSEAQCEELRADLYVAASGGCLSLISSGQSRQDSEFIDASESGDDVFFTTNESLLPTDTGLVDVYDARVGGGFPFHTTPPECLGETCQPVVSPPQEQTPASSSYEGPGNLEEKPKKHHHKKHKHRKKRAKKKRRAGR